MQDPQSIGLDEVRTLHRAGVISQDRFLDAVYLCRDRAFWTRWSLVALLALGVGHALAGIIFFFAYNWADLSAFAKFAIVGAGIVVSVVLALILDPDRPAGRALLLSATVLVGVLFAVISQVYQTGADAWSLFAMWMLLTLPWVLASRSAAHWLVWLVVAYMAANLYGYQVLLVDEIIDAVELQCLISIVLALVLGIREWAVRAGMRWLDAVWTRAIPAFMAALIVFCLATVWVFDWNGSGVATLLFVAMIASLSVVYSRVLPDFPVIAICGGFTALFLMAIGVRLLEETIGFDDDSLLTAIFSLLILLLWCAALTAGVLKFLAFARRRIPKERGDG